MPVWEKGTFQQSMHHWLTALLAGLVVTGCHPLPVSNGPDFRWAGTTDISIPIAASQIPLKLIDTRPEWQSQFREVAQAPEEFHFAMGFVPMENLNPPVPDSLRSIVLNALPSADSGTFGNLTIHSFAVVIDERELREAEFADLCSRNSSAGLSIELTDGVEFSFGADQQQPFHDPVIPTAATSPTTVIKNGELILQGPPEELPDEYMEGITCRFSVTVNLYPAGEVQQKFTIDASARLPFQFLATKTRDAAIREVVSRAVDDFEVQFRLGLVRHVPPNP